MQIKQLDHINFSVNNLEESAQWYARVFGFEMVERGVAPSGAPWGIMKSGEAMLAMYERPDSRRPLPDEFKEMKIHNVNHFSFRIEDRSRFEEHLVQEKVEIDHEWSYPHSHSWYLYDPNGYEIEVACWETDEIRF